MSAEATARIKALEEKWKELEAKIVELEARIARLQTEEKRPTITLKK